MYLSGKYSLKQVSIKYNISDKSILKSWISKYNSHKEINSTPKELDKSMAKSRKTTEITITKEKQLEIENREYKEKIKRLEAENALLKKLKEMY